FLVHFARPVTPEDKEWLDRETAPVRRADGSPLARWYVPNDALAAWVADPATFERLAVADPVDLVVRYQPGYKRDPTVGAGRLPSTARVGRAILRLNGDLVPGHTLEDVELAIARFGGLVRERVVTRGARTYDGRCLGVDVAPALVTRLAWIE